MCSRFKVNLNPSCLSVEEGSSSRCYGRPNSALLSAIPFQQIHSTKPMAAIELSVFSHQTTEGLAYQHLHIRITAPNGIIAPADLKALTLPDNMIWSQGVVIEGKAPTWLYAYLVHAC
ncbi:MAG: CRISPR-associated protein Csx3, partial [Pseudomonadota bacterium]